VADHTSTQLPPALVDALREPAPVSDRARRLDTIMTAVHGAPAPSRALRYPPTRSRWRRGLLAPAGALMVALMVTLWGGLASFTTVLERGATTVLARADVVGDSVVERLAAPRVAIPRRDTVFATLYDTLRIVRFALRAPAASQVSLIEVAASARAASVSSGTLIAAARQVADGLWELRTVVPRDAVARAYAFVIDESQQVPVPMGRTGWSSVGVHRESPHTAKPAYPVRSDSAL
jgi:hypothetical protein